MSHWYEIVYVMTPFAEILRSWNNLHQTLDWTWRLIQTVQGWPSCFHRFLEEYDKLMLMPAFVSTHPTAIVNVNSTNQGIALCPFSFFQCSPQSTSPVSRELHHYQEMRSWASYDFLKGNTTDTFVQPHQYWRLSQDTPWPWVDNGEIACQTVLHSTLLQKQFLPLCRK